jgi:hypothetical protein
MQKMIIKKYMAEMQPFEEPRTGAQSQLAGMSWSAVLHGATEPSCCHSVAKLWCSDSVNMQPE